MSRKIFCNALGTLERVLNVLADSKRRASPSGGCAAIALLLLAVVAPPALAQVFGPVEALDSNASLDTGDDIYPEIATDGGGTWVAVWGSSDTLGGTIGADMDILVARSTDGGATWTALAPLNSNAAGSVGWNLEPQVAADGAGTWVAVWDSEDSPGGWFRGPVAADILVVRSTDGGATWTAPVALDANAAGDSMRDDFPQIATDGAGTWMAVWQSSGPHDGASLADAHILVARSTDG